MIRELLGIARSYRRAPRIDCLGICFADLKHEPAERVCELRLIVQGEDNRLCLIDPRAAGVYVSVKA